MIRQLVLTLLLAMIVPTITVSVASAQALTTAEKRYNAASRERAQLLARLNDLEQQYKGLVKRIEQRKRAGAMDTFAGRLELGNLLRESKALADKLGKLQEDVRALDTRLDLERDKVLASIDADVAHLERRLSKANNTERRRLVDQLNKLRRRRSNYSAPLPEAPTLAEVRDAISLAEEVDPSQPEELLAAADELQDTEDQIRRRLDAVRERLDGLNRRKRLMRRAESFQREERFFEETDRNRVIARVDRNNSGNQGDQNADDQANEEPASANNTNGEVTAGAGSDDFQSGAPTESDDVNNLDLAADPAAAPENRDTTDFTDAPDSPAAAPASDNGGDDPFGSASDTVVISAGADPSRAVNTESRRLRDVDAAIEELEEEEEELSKQAEELRERAKDLRKKADL